MTWPATVVEVSSPRPARVVHEVAGGSTEEIVIRLEPGQTVSMQENDPERLALVGLAVPAQASTQPRTR